MTPHIVTIPLFIVALYYLYRIARRFYRRQLRRKLLAFWIRKITYKPSTTEFPIQFVMPNERIAKNIPKKKYDFSYVIPGITQYDFEDETFYYQHYGACYFAITIKKAGWESLRHYEILASGAIPYFLDIEKCPPDTLFLWPKNLLIEAQNLPGVPTAQEVKRAIKQKTTEHLKINFELFNQQCYDTLLTKLRNHLRNHMSTQALGAYFLERLPIKNIQKILYIFQEKKDWIIDYTRDLLISGLIKQPTVELQTYPACPWLFDDYPLEKARQCYGKGFTITRNLSLPKPKTPDQEQLIQLLKQHYFDMVIINVVCMKQSLVEASMPETFWQVLKQHPHVVAVDGNDIWQSHDIPDYCSYSFCREIPHHN